MKPLGAIQLRLLRLPMACASLSLAPQVSRADDQAGAAASTEAIRYDSRESDVQAPQPDPAKVNQIPAYVVQEPIFKAYLSPSESEMRELFRGMSMTFSPLAFGINFGTAYASTPARAYQPLSDVPNLVEVRPETAKADPILGWPDDGLASIQPLWFGLRDTDPVPSPAKTSPELRGVGGEGREIKLLLDGVSANDPFTGAFVPAAMPALGVSRIEAVADGGAVAWGDGDLGGALQQFTSPDLGRLVIRPGAPTPGGAPDPSLPKQVVIGTGEFLAAGGGLDTRDVEVAAVEPTPLGAFQLLGRDFTTDGSSLVSGGRSGPIDVAAYSRNQFLEARWSQLISKNLLLTATVNGFDESSGAGTPYQGHRGEGEFAAVQLEGRPSRDFLWTAVAYARRSEGSDRFSAVDANRAAETPILDEFATPTTEVGASWSGQWRSTDGSRTSAGLEASDIRGEARLLAGDVQGSFTRGLAGGGEQGDGGAFLERDQKLGDSVHVTVGGRVSHWDESDGHDRLLDLATGAVLPAAGIAGSQGTEFSPQLGATWTPDNHWLFHADAQQAFSRPTLSDQYGPVGQYSILTENNPDLRTEHNTSFELGVEYSFYSAKELESHKSGFAALRPPKAFLTLGATAFDNQMRDALGARSLSSDPILFASGVIPAGYRDQQRINLDRSRSEGLDLFARWQIAPVLSLQVSALLDDPTIGKSSAEPTLVGRQLAGVPRQGSDATLSWDPWGRLRLLARVRYIGREFEDDENTLRLGAALTEDLGAAFTLAKNVELSASLRNLGNDRIELARSPEGFSYGAPPRNLFVALRLKW